MDHGGEGLIAPYPRECGVLVSIGNTAPGGGPRELRLHETRPGVLQAMRWHETHLGWCGQLAHGLTSMEWAACGRAVPMESGGVKAEGATT